MELSDTLRATPPGQRLLVAIALDARTQWQIAQAARLNPSVISHYAKGRRQPSPAHQRVLARTLGVPVAVLFPPACEVA